MTIKDLPLPIFAEISAGAVIYKKDGAGFLIAVIHRKKMNDFSLPKGHQELGESLQQTLQREILEETGWTVETEKFVKLMSYRVINKDKGREYWRNVYWFLARAEKKVSPLADLEEVDEVKWLSMADAQTTLSHDNEREVLVQAIGLLQENE